MSFRTMLTRTAPSFLKGPWAQKFLYAPGLVLDGMFEWLIQGMIARFPSVGTPTAYPHIARDRGIVLGFNEPIEGQQARLVRALDDRKIQGNAQSILRQLYGYLATYNVQIAIVNTRGTWHVMKDGVVTISKLTGNWNWQFETPEEWSRFWVIIWPLESELWEDEGVWGEDEIEWGDGGVWGLSATSEQVESIREIVTRWKAAGRRGVWTIVALDSDSFDPGSPPLAADMPDGHWRDWGYDDGLGVRREVRLDTARYMYGTTRPSSEVEL